MVSQSLVEADAKSSISRRPFSFDPKAVRSRIRHDDEKSPSAIFAESSANAQVVVNWTNSAATVTASAAYRLPRSQENRSPFDSC